HLHRRAILGMDHPAADQIAELVGGEIGAREYCEHARHRLRCLSVDAFDACMRVGRAHEAGMGLSGTTDVGGVMALAGNESLVLFAAHRGADAGRAHALPPEPKRTATRRPSASCLLPSPWPGRRPQSL